MITIMTRLPVFVTQAGRAVRLDPVRTPDGDVVAFVNAPRRRSVVSIVTGVCVVEVTVEGLTSAFEAEYVEPFGDVTMWLTEGHDGTEWLVVDLDGKQYPDAQMRFGASEVAAVLADIALAACLDDVTAPRRGGAS